jgi:hypothetical protein
MKLSGKKFLLLILYTPSPKGEFNIPIVGRTRIMKMGFLFEKEIKSEFMKENPFEDIALPEFFAWKYGPFSVGLLNDLEFLINQNYINVELSPNVPLPAELEEYKYWHEDFSDIEYEEYTEEIFSLIPDRGISKAIELWDALNDKHRNLLIKFKDVLGTARLDRILEYVYKKYKEDGYTDKSIIRERFLS